jgi:hypothetical protein
LINNMNNQDKAAHAARQDYYKPSIGPASYPKQHTSSGS